jgi:hypothetical protein
MTWTNASSGSPTDRSTCDQNACSCRDLHVLDANITGYIDVRDVSGPERYKNGMQEITGVLQSCFCLQTKDSCPNQD